MSVIDDIEYLGSQIKALIEAEDLAIQVNHSTLPEIRRLHSLCVKKLLALAKKILKRKVSLA